MKRIVFRVLLFVMFLGIILVSITLTGTNSLISEIVDTDIKNYNNYIGANALDMYRNKYNIDESIFPNSIIDTMDILDYKMVYNEVDKEYVSILRVKYSLEDYIKEITRLNGYNSKEYYYYGVTGFNSDYILLAIEADNVYGFVYAISNGNNEIVYIEIIFSNYYMNIDYEKYIDKEYLPVNIDLSIDNKYREKFLK